jgi:hypothetical protein
MNKTQKITIGLISVSIGILIAGCGMLASSPNPQYIIASPTGQLTTNNAVAPLVYSPPASLNNISNEVETILPLVQSIISATPVAVASPLLPSAANLVLGGIGGVFALLAAYKNNQANQHAAAAASLAATVVQSGQTAQAMTIAATNQSSAIVAQHIASAQSLT